MSITDEDYSLSKQTKESLEISLSSKTSNESASHDDSEVEFADVVEKLNFAINNVRQLKPWKDRALKAERANRQMTLTINRLKEELNDSEYEVQKWKKRALRAEDENQNEILKWKNKVIESRSNREMRDDPELLMVDNIADGETFTNLVSARDDDESTISTFRDDSKYGHDLTGQSFRSKWENMGFIDKQPVMEKNDGASTVAAQQILQNFERGNVFPPTKVPDDSSTVAAEEILNNYLHMKGRFNSRRFDTTSRMTSGAQTDQSEI